MIIKINLMRYSQPLIYETLVLPDLIIHGSDFQPVFRQLFTCHQQHVKSVMITTILCFFLLLDALPTFITQICVSLYQKGCEALIDDPRTRKKTREKSINFIQA